MSRLYGTVQGSRGEATRCGHQTLTTHAAGWRGAIRVTVSAATVGEDYYTVELVPWKGSGGRARVLATGLLDANDADARHERVITGTGGPSERRELDALCRALRAAP